MTKRGATSATVLVVDDDPEIAFQLEYRSETGRHRYRGIKSLNRHSHDFEKTPLRRLSI